MAAAAAVTGKLTDRARACRLNLRKSPSRRVAPDTRVLVSAACRREVARAQPTTRTRRTASGTDRHSDRRRAGAARLRGRLARCSPRSRLWEPSPRPRTGSLDAQSAGRAQSLANSGSLPAASRGRVQGKTSAKIGMPQLAHTASPSSPALVQSRARPMRLAEKKSCGPVARIPCLSARRLPIEEA
jgi:hypothetical protein